MDAVTAKNIVVISKTLLDWLGDGESYRTRPVGCTIDGVSRGVYVINVVRLNKTSLYVQEIVSSDLRGQIVYRSWSLVKKRVWRINEIEKYNTPLTYHQIKGETADLIDRIAVILAVQAGSGSYYSEALEDAENILKVDLPEDTELKRNGPFSKLNMFFYRYQAIVIAGILAVGILGLITTYSIHLYSFKKKVETSLDDYSRNVDTRTKEFFKNTEGQISTLVNKLKQNQESFDFDRRNAYVNVLRMAEELTRYFPARKKAYRLIAENILNAANYSEILYEISKLPTEEYQARIFLATDRETVTPLAVWEPVFSSMVYPVKLDTEKNDGRGFRITDGYMSIRENPLGSGGSSPHYAVDIINVSNISYVDNAGRIIREGNPPGEVVAAFSGIVMDKGTDTRYGNYLLLKHDINDEILSKYPKAESWGTYYAHLKDPVPLKMGERVSADQIIGKIGNTGHSTGPHLHFEVHIYEKTGIYSDVIGRFNKVNPFPSTYHEKSKKR